MLQSSGLHQLHTVSHRYPNLLEKPSVLLSGSSQNENFNLCFYCMFSNNKEYKNGTNLNMNILGDQTSTPEYITKLLMPKNF